MTLHFSAVRAPTLASGWEFHVLSLPTIHNYSRLILVTGYGMPTGAAALVAKPSPNKPLDTNHSPALRLFNVSVR